MIEVSGIRVPLSKLDGTDSREKVVIRQALARRLHVRQEELGRVTRRKRSIDARKKGDIQLIFTLRAELAGGASAEKALLARLASKREGGGVRVVEAADRDFPLPLAHAPHDQGSIIVVGAGCAGLFCALSLARAGLEPLLVERGDDAARRSRVVRHHDETGELDPESNIQFGVGGAGTFSDGKLTTGTHDPRLTHVMETFVAAGAPEDILWQHKPHVGTDLLRQVVNNLRKEIQALGGEVRFGHRLSGLTLAGKQLTEIQVDQGRVTYTMPCDTLILAPGHSARDTFRMLRQAGAAMEQKPFAIGVRIEHEQARISRAQFGESWEKLPPADYKLVCHLPNGRSAYTFCVCPGGQIVAAASQPGGVVTNGMSNRARDGKFINGGFLVGVGPGDFGSDDPLAGVAFQELWEAKAYAFGRPGYEAPAQRVGDLLRGVPTPNSLTHRSTYQPNVIFGDLRETLPNYVTDTLAQALPALDKKLHGFAAPDALLVGVETRSSSPLRILRGKDFQSDLRGLYPCGEGAGYAGGIVSAAVDGVRVAEAVAHPPVWTE